MRNKVKWAARIVALAILLFGLPFYFGYGNPLPFINPEYGIFDNLWLTIFPLMFISLGLGFKYEKLAGYLLVGMLSVGFIVSFFLKDGLAWPMLGPLAAGGLYLWSGYLRVKK